MKRIHWKQQPSKQEAKLRPVLYNSIGTGYWVRPVIHLIISYSACWGKGLKKQSSNPWNRKLIEGCFGANRNSGAFWASDFIQVIDGPVWLDLNLFIILPSISFYFIIWQHTREKHFLLFILSPLSDYFVVFSLLLVLWNIANDHSVFNPSMPPLTWQSFLGAPF